MRTQHLEEFVVFSRHLNFGEAAEELFIAKSTLSTHIAQLEHETGLKLVDRANGNALTPEGAIFLEGAKTALGSLNDTIGRCSRFRQETDRRVRIACSAPTTALASLLSTRIDVPFCFVDCAFGEQPFAALDADRADLAITYSFACLPRLVDEAREHGLAFECAKPFPLSIVMMKTHPLATRKRLARPDLAQATIMTSGMLGYEHDRLLTTNLFGEDLRLAFAPGSMQSFNDLLIVDLSPALLLAPKEAAHRCCAGRGDMALFDDVDGRPFGFPMAVVWRKGASPVVERAAATLHACMKKIECDEGLCDRSALAQAG